MNTKRLRQRLAAQYPWAFDYNKIIDTLSLSKEWISVTDFNILLEDYYPVYEEKINIPNAYFKVRLIFIIEMMRERKEYFQLKLL